VDATSKNIAEGILRIGADGVVRNVFDHPVCASKWLRSILDRAATPPLEEGNSSSFTMILGTGTLLE
jgi:hypothetical protein